MIRRTWAALAAAAVLVAPLLAAGAPAGAAQPGPDPVVVTLRQMSATGQDPIVFSGQVTNTGPDTLRDLRVQLRRQEAPLNSRTAIVEYTQSNDASPGFAVDGALATVAASLAPGVSAPWTLSVPAARLGLDAHFGVYGIALDVRGELPSGDRSSLGLIRTFLPWVPPGGTVLPTKVAFVVPVLATPTRAADGTSATASLHDQLTGRLQTVLNAVAGHRVTYALDGDLLEAAASDAADSTGPSWLAGLAAQLPGSGVFAVPYADPDLVAVTRAGLGADVTGARTLGAQAVRAELPAGTVVTDDLAWPADNTLDGATQSTVVQSGARAVLVADRFAPGSEPTSYTPSAVGPIAGSQLTAVAADTVLSGLLNTAVTRQGGAVIARQRFLAELAMITAELPSVQRGVVVVPPRGWSPDAGYVRGLLQAVEGSPFAQLATVAELRSAAGIDGPERKSPAFPNRLVDGLVDSDQLADVSTAHARLGTLTAVLTTPAPIVAPLGKAILRAESAAWRQDHGAGQTYARGVLGTVTTIANKVHLIGNASLTLSGQSGRIPVTIANDLDQPVKVRVLLTAVPAIRLTLERPAAVTVAAGQRQTVEVGAQAAGNGAVEVEVVLTTPDGNPYGAPVRFPVQVTGLGAVASAVVGGALALLAVALLVRIGRAMRQGRRPGSPASVREKAATP